jgi:ADP-ribosyl-[dinitrogen reductase] hydrolase
MDISNRFRGCLLGLAVGDAVGTTVEFKPRGTFSPVTDMVGGGPFNLKPGAWTDDTSMALCLATSLIYKKGFDPKDQMNRYCNWYEHGYLSSTDRCFDIGVTVRNALQRYLANGEPFSGSTDPNSAGNGSIMRLAPIPMYYFPHQELILQYSAESSRTTHGAQECVDACRLLGDILYRALSGTGKQDILLGSDAGMIDSPSIKNLVNGVYFNKTEDAIHGNGYVVTSLEAALWCFWTTDSYREAILKAANLGEDADTTAAICGQVAGAYYGETGIPESWRDILAMRREIEDLAEALRKNI